MRGNVNKTDSQKSKISLIMKHGVRIILSLFILYTVCIITIKCYNKERHFGAENIKKDIEEYLTERYNEYFYIELEDGNMWKPNSVEATIYPMTKENDVKSFQVEGYTTKWARVKFL